MSEALGQALQLGIYGLAGVFGALMVLFIVLKVTVRLFSHKKEEGSKKN
ncbi:MAG: hypothetical protein FWE60_01095 [Oscillospiraceae bacterium]|nr:hypothetical protein [Oscillospiraceae bacterium]